MSLSPPPTLKNCGPRKSFNYSEFTFNLKYKQEKDNVRKAHQLWEMYGNTVVTYFW